MVVAMHRIDELLGTIAFGDGVEGKPVHQILEEGPEKKAGEKDQRESPGQVAKVGVGVIQEVDNNRQIHPPNDQGMGLCQHLQIMILK